ncbi:MAG: hypothetical protein NZ473_02720 [Candidatus Kapabacteria bacterium]|nr:hypothetical protein [Candidatus Kapabacteria bacterium]MCS7170266.1 hypothetical protein [Candidatus Kapabacteria bacterium]MDW7997268.1 hypothetical protein [Bacteroidota bacterium]MDW8224815.1 hypothetical protein [Bacteroidota bacterium]
MSTKLLKALACVFVCATSAKSQFFVDFHAHGTVSWRIPTSSSIVVVPLPTVGIGWGSRLRSFFVPSIDIVLSGLRTRSGTHEEYLIWGELQYRLLLQLYHSQQPQFTPAVALELGFPFGLSASEGWREALSTDLRALRLGTFVGVSVPSPISKSYVHILTGGHWLLRSPRALRSALIPELRLVWESR